MKPYLSVLLLLAFIGVPGCTRPGEVQYASFTQGWGDSMLTQVTYGFTDDRLHFVVFESAQHELIPHAKLLISPGPIKGHPVCTGYLELPDGSRSDLPASDCIFELGSGRSTSTPIDFTRTQLKAYLATKPKPPTMAGFKQFRPK